MHQTIVITGGSGFIGTSLIDLLETDKNYKIINLDRNSPVKPSHSKYWVKADLLVQEEIENVFSTYEPGIVIHLAARTDTLSDKLEDYIDNTLGTENLIKVIEKSLYITHAIITSTQYVYKLDSMPLPDRDDHYEAHTVYGESKVITEELTRKSNMSCIWTIVRPTNIWGPWHMRYPVELWRMIDKGLYMHPGYKEVIRTYGYVKNVAHQILQIMLAAPERVHKKTFYLGDTPIDSYIWLNQLSMRMTKKKLKRLPKVFFKGLSVAGDGLRAFKLPFPLYSERYRNMIEDYIAPTNVTISEFGQSHPDLEKNVDETVSWLENEGKDYFEYWKNK